MVVSETQDDPFQRLQHELVRPPFNEWLGTTAISVSAEARSVEVGLTFRPEFSHHPSEQYFHGGVLSALVDIVGHAAVAVWHGAPTPTIHLSVDYLKPARGDRLVAKGFLRRLGRSISRSDVEIYDGDQLVALGRGIFNSTETT